MFSFAHPSGCGAVATSPRTSAAASEAFPARFGSHRASVSVSRRVSASLAARMLVSLTFCVRVPPSSARGACTGGVNRRCAEKRKEGRGEGARRGLYSQIQWLPCWL